LFFAFKCFYKLLVSWIEYVISMHPRGNSEYLFVGANPIRCQNPTAVGTDRIVMVAALDCRIKIFTVVCPIPLFRKWGNICRMSGAMEAGLNTTKPATTPSLSISRDLCKARVKSNPCRRRCRASLCVNFTSEIIARPEQKNRWCCLDFFGNTAIAVACSKQKPI
jgi:hypothetical protein